MPLPRDFYPSAVTECKVLKAGKVYLLTLSDDTQVVIKAESQNFTITDRQEERKKMDFGFKLSAKLGSSGETRVMDQMEVKRLDKLKSMFSDPSYDWDIALDPRYNAQTSWLLMEAVPGLSNLDDLIGKGKEFEALKMVWALHDKENLIAFGKILAMDCFLGNSDRFVVDDSSADDPIKNYGNVFFQKKADKSLRVVGIDPMDPNSGWAKLDQDILTCTTAAQNRAGSFSEESKQWPGLILLSDRRMRDLGKRCLRAVMNEVITKAKFDAKAAKTWQARGKHFDLVEKGMKKGRDEIKMMSKLRVNVSAGRAKAPSGLQSRMRALGWIK